MRKATIGAAAAVLAFGAAAVPAGATSHDDGTTQPGIGVRSGSATAESARGQVDEYVAYSDESQENPRTGIDSWAWSVFRIHEDRIEYSTTIFGLDEDVIGAHLHLAPRGANGPVIVDLTGDVVDNTRLAGTISADDLDGDLTFADLLAEIAADRVYLNVHTPTFPGGAIRGQLVDSPNFVPDDGAAQVVEHHFDLNAVDHDPARDGGSDPSGRVHLRLDGDQLTVTVEVDGLAPGLVHAQHLHGIIGEDGASMPGQCPDRGADADGDGLISTVEGVPDYGVVAVSLTTTGATDADSALAIDRMPVADDEGRLRYERTFTVEQDLADRLDDLQFVVHGIDVNNDDTYDMGAGPSSLDPSLPLEATVPAACGASTTDDDTDDMTDDDMTDDDMTDDDMTDDEMAV